MVSADMEKLGYAGLHMPMYALLLALAIHNKCTTYIWAGSITVAITATLALPRRVFPTDEYFLIQWALLVLSVIAYVVSTCIACYCEGGVDVCPGTPLILLWLIGMSSARGGIIIDEWNSDDAPVQESA